AVRVVDATIATRRRIGEERRIAPQRPAVATPEDPNGPARQRLARIPLAEPVEAQCTWREAAGETKEQPFCKQALRGRMRRRVPLRAFHVVAGDECRLAALRETHVLRGERGVDRFPERVDRTPLRFGI